MLKIFAAVVAANLTSVLILAAVVNFSARTDATWTAVEASPPVAAP